MSRPVGVQQVSPLQQRTGITLALGPTSDPTLRWQLRSAVGSSTGTFTTYPDLAGQFGPGQYPTFTDVLPLDGQTRCYQHRAVRNDGTVVGAWSPVLKAKPVVLPEGPTLQTPVTGHKVGSHLSLSTGIKVQYGSGNVPLQGMRTTLYPATLWGAGSSTAPAHHWLQSDGALRMKNGAGVAAGSSGTSFIGSLILPASATITGITVYYKRTAAQKIQWIIDTCFVGSTSAASVVWSTANPSTAATSVTKTVTITSTQYDYLRAVVGMRTTAPTGSGAFYGMRLTYTVPSYDKTV